MSVQEIQVQLEKLSAEELAEVEKRVRILRVVTAPGYKEKIAEAQRRVDAGKLLTAEEVEVELARRDRMAVVD
jgi:hypothetical protein